jgi:hypothetical protein
MKQKIYSNHSEITTQLKLMRIELKCREKNIKADAKNYVVSLPKKAFRIFVPTTSAKSSINNNPIGKIISKTIKNTLLKKEGFITKFFVGILLKKLGKKVESKLLH